MMAGNTKRAVHRMAALAPGREIRVAPLHQPPLRARARQR